MYKILLATDGAPHSKVVIDRALAIAEAMDAEVTILTVVREYVFSPRVNVQFTDENWKAIHDQLEAEADAIISEAEKPFKEKGIITHREIVIGHKSPADVICEMARDGNFDLTILGSSGKSGIQEMFLGSVSNKVAHMNCSDVLIVK